VYKGLGLGGEAAYAHFNLFGLDHTSWTGSADASYHFRRHAARRGVDPFVLGGFSLYGPTHKGGGTGEAGGNFGGGANLWLTKHAALRLELRDYVHGDYFLPGTGAFSDLSFRVGMTFR